MIFQGTPDMLVRITRKIPGVRIKMFRFDLNGEYETENVRLGKLLSNRFPVKEPIVEPEVEVKGEPKVESKTYSCKTCGEQFDNKGKFLAHMREHKRGE